MKSIDPISAPSAESNPIRTAIEQAIAENPVILFMKGSPEAPACGFSRRTVAVLQTLDASFAAVDVLPDPRIRQELPRCRTGRRSRSCSWRESWWGAATSSSRCTSRASLAEALGVAHGEGDGVAHGEGGGAAPELPDESAASGLQIENRLG